MDRFQWWLNSIPEPVAFAIVGGLYVGVGFAFTLLCLVVVG